MNLTQTNAAKAAVMPKPSAALTRFSPDPNMPADALHPEFQSLSPHLPSPSASVLPPTPPTTSHCEAKEVCLPLEQAAAAAADR